MPFSDYISKSDIEMERSVSVSHNFTGATSNIQQFYANLNLGFAPDICVVEQVSYIASANEWTVYTLFADFCNGLRNQLDDNNIVYTEPLASFIDNGCTHLGQVVKVQKPIQGQTQFTVEGLAAAVRPNGFLSFTLRFIKYKHQK